MNKNKRRFWDLSLQRKAQVRLTETVAVLFIFFILVMFGMIFYYHYYQVSLQDKQAELFASRAMDTTLTTLFLPELMCSKGEAEPESNCIDLMKLRHLNPTFQDHLVDYYFEMFSYAKITVNQTYPPPSKEWVIYEKVPDEIEFYDPTYFVVALKDDLTGSYGFGYLEVGVYS
tara:strand:- start:140 stop:658 length:519 start_codon:yes stop_codon:yes gene_type:complete